MVDFQNLSKISSIPDVGISGIQCSVSTSFWESKKIFIQLLPELTEDRPNDFG